MEDLDETDVAEMVGAALQDWPMGKEVGDEHGNFFEINFEDVTKDGAVLHFTLFGIKYQAVVKKSEV